MSFQNTQELAQYIVNKIIEFEKYDEKLDKNNNPGNLYDPSKKVYKNLEVDENGFIKFKTQKEGLKAFERDLLLFISKNKSLKEYLTSAYDLRNLTELQKIVVFDINTRLGELVKNGKKTTYKRRIRRSFGGTV